MDYTLVPYSDTFYHHGVLGMKWGIRRYQNTDGTLTTAGKKRYKATASDTRIYGKSGAERIAKRRNKGDSRRTAVLKELGSQVAMDVTAIALSSLTIYAVTSGKYKNVIKAGRKMIDSYNNIQVLDKNGKVLKKYHSSVKTGYATISKLLKG